MNPFVVAATDYVGLALLITALGTFVTAAASAVVIVRKVTAVQQEVRTFNETTAGGLAAAGETRRVEAIPHDERTAKEQRHLDDAPPEENPQGPGR